MNGSTTSICRFTTVSCLFPSSFVVGRLVVKSRNRRRKGLHHVLRFLQASTQARAQAHTHTHARQISLCRKCYKEIPSMKWIICLVLCVLQLLCLIVAWWKSWGFLILVTGSRWCVSHHEVAACSTPLGLRFVKSGDRTHLLLLVLSWVSSQQRPSPMPVTMEKEHSIAVSVIRVFEFNETNFAWSQKTSHQSLGSMLPLNIINHGFNKFFKRDFPIPVFVCGVHKLNDFPLGQGSFFFQSSLQVLLADRSGFVRI